MREFRSNRAIAERPPPEPPPFLHADVTELPQSTVERFPLPWVILMSIPTIKTICCYCGVGCGIEIGRKKSGQLTLRGDPDHPVNQGMLCSKGRTLLHVVASQQERLQFPQVRLDRAVAPRRTTWDAALAHVASTFQRIIRDHGPDAVAFYGSGQLLTEEYYVTNKLVKGFLGTNNFDTNSRMCMSSAVVGYKKTLGVDGPPVSYEDIAFCDTFLVTGSNAAYAHPILWRRVEARKQADPNVKIIVVDPRRTATCASADLHLQLIPGTDVALHYGLARQLITLGAINPTFIAEHVTGWAEFQAVCEPWTLAATATTCGLAEADLAQAAEWLAGDRRFLSLWTMGLNQSSVGVDKNTTLIALSLITGKIGLPGCGPFSLTGQPNAMGGREVGGMATLASNHRELNNPADTAEIARFWGVASVPTKPGHTAVDLFEAIDQGKVKAVWILATNPVESLPDAARFEAALAKAELVVVQDCYPTATSACADVILPAATWLEKSGTMTNSERRISLLNAVVTAPGEALPDAEIICTFAAALGHGAAFPYFQAGGGGAAGIFAEHVALTAGRDCTMAGMSHARLAEGSLQWPLPNAGHPGTPRLYTDHQFPTSDGKARLQAPPFTWRTERPSPERPLILTTGRLRDQWHTMTKTGRVAKLRDHQPAPLLEIHPDDARSRGITNGSPVEIRSSRGAAVLLATVTNDIRPGVVFAPMHWGRQRGGITGRINDTANPDKDPASHEPDLKYAAVEVSIVQPPRRRIVIIGGGAATRAFLDHHTAAGLKDRIIVFGDEAQALYNRVLLPHYVSGHNAWDSLVTASQESLAAKGVDFRPGVAVTAIDRQAKEVVDAKGQRTPYDVLILATGSRSAKLYHGPMPQSGVHFLRKRGDAESIRDRAGPGKKAVIVGGGLLGLELADALHHLGTEVTVLQRGDRLMGRQLDARAGTLLAEALQERGITIRFKTQVDELLGTEQIRGLKLVGGGELPADLVVFATGTVANAELARHALITCATGILVDHHLQTNDPAIFAMGEVAEFQGAAAHTTAASEVQAKHVVEWLRGNPHAPYPGPFDANLLKIEGVPLASAGETDPDPGTAEIITFEDVHTGVYQKAVVRNDRLVGILLFGDTSGFPAYRDLIANGVELEDRRSSLLRGSGTSAPVEGALICSCNQVGTGTIERLVREGITDLPTLCARSQGGTGCGSCRPEVLKIAAKACRQTTN